MPHTRTGLGTEGSAVFMAILHACVFRGGGWTERKNFIRVWGFIFTCEDICCLQLQHLFEFPNQKKKPKLKLHLKEIYSQFQVRVF